MPNLSELLAEGASGLAIEAHLDALSDYHRKRECEAITRRQQISLYNRASPVITMEHFVPGGEVLKPVVHNGINNQPAFRLFQKPMTIGEDGVVFGYNEGVTRPAIGPGYFVARETDGDDRGHVVVDYFMTPVGPTPSGWPTIEPNSRGLQQFVFHRCRDYMRRVSKHVSVGKAYKEESTIMGYFILVREDD